MMETMPSLPDKELVLKYQKSLGADILLFNELDDEAKKILDKELTRLWNDFEKAQKAGEVKKAELIAESMALLGKCALNGRGSSSLKGKIRKYLEKEKYNETYKNVATLYGNMGTAKDRDFLLRADEKTGRRYREDEIAGAGLGHCCSAADLDWLSGIYKEVRT